MQDLFHQAERILQTKMSREVMSQQDFGETQPQMIDMVPHTPLRKEDSGANQTTAPFNMIQVSSATGGGMISMQDSGFTDHNATATFFAASGLKSASQVTEQKFSFSKANQRTPYNEQSMIKSPDQLLTVSKIAKAETDSKQVSPFREKDQQESFEPRTQRASMGIRNKQRDSIDSFPILRGAKGQIQIPINNRDDELSNEREAKLELFALSAGDHGHIEADSRKNSLADLIEGQYNFDMSKRLLKDR